MSNLLLKIKIWTKVILFALILIYALLFFGKNSERMVQVWVYPNHDVSSSIFWLVVGAFLAGVIGAILVRTLFTTVRQIREASARGRAQKLEREVADMKSKAAMLQTKSSPDPDPSTPA